MIYLKWYNFLILKCDDFGHKNSNAVMPIGGKAKMDTADCSVRLLEQAIER